MNKTHKYDLTYYGNDILRHHAERINRIDDDLLVLVDEMAKIMYDNQGIGLAGPQAGVALDIFLADIGDELHVFLNPEIKKTNADKELFEEGCLSLPEVTVIIERPTEVEVEYMNLEGETVTEEFSGLLARVIQHEMDHLKGKLIIDYMGTVDRDLIRKKLRAIAKKSKRKLL